MMHRFTSHSGVDNSQRGPDPASSPGLQGGRRYPPSGPLTPLDPIDRGARTRGRV